VRIRASEWDIDPEPTGVTRFSAGDGELWMASAGYEAGIAGISLSKQAPPARMLALGGENLVLRLRTIAVPLHRMRT
jgi:hypothetical protein